MGSLDLAPQPPAVLAQTNLPDTDGASPSLDPLPEEAPLPVLPTPEELLGPDITPPPLPDTNLPGDDATIVIQRFEVVGSTVFSEADFETITTDYVDRPITFTEVRAVRDAISQLYLDNGYITSGAIIPPQAIQDSVVQIQVVEGGVEEIVIEGTQRLLPGYVSSRINLGTGAPLQVERLLERLQLLRLDPLIDNISADLQAGTRPGTNLLVVSVTEATSFSARYTLDNNRNPSVGSIRNQIQLTERNLTGLGDGLTLGYNITSGSQDVDFAYTLPINPYNGTLSFSLGYTGSEVLESPFEILEVTSNATVAELTLRQPVIQTPTQELALGLIASRQGTQTFLGIADIGGFPLSAGANDEGRIAVTALRFFQEWSQRSPKQVIALRSQFNLGLDALGSTVNSGDIPDSQFFSWLGQGQWVQLLGPDTPLLLRGSIQLTPDPLLTLERYGLGGQATVRGYSQDEVLTDNGANLSLEVRLPIWRDRNSDGLLQVTPFIEGGVGWNTQEADPDPNSLLSIGTGLLLQVENLDVRADFGIPLISTDGDNDTLQEQGIYFSLGYSFF